MKRIFILFTIVLAFLSCNDHAGSEKNTARNVKNTTAPRVPSEILALIDTLNKGNLADIDTIQAMKLVDGMLLKYPKWKAPYAYHLLIQQKLRNYLIRNNNDSIIKYGQEGLRFFEQQPYFTKWPLIDHYRLCIAYYEKNQYDSCNIHSSKARLAIQDTLIYKFLQPYMLMPYLIDFATVSRSTLYYNDAITNIDAAIQLGQKLPEDKKFLLSEAFLEKVAIYNELANQDSAAKYLAIAKQMVKRYPDEKTTRLLLAFSGKCYLAAAKYDSAMLVMNQYEKLQQAENPDYRSFQYDLLDRAEANLFTGNFKEADKLFAMYKKDMKLYPQAFTLRDSSSLYRGLTEFYLVTGNTAKAKETFSKYLEIEPRYINEKHIQTVKAMEVRYELGKKEKAIAQLRLNALEYQLSIRKKNQILWVIAGASIIALLSGLFAFSLQRQKRLKTEKEKLQQQIAKVQLEQRLLRTQMEPHFIFNSLTAMRSFIREGEGEKSISYLNAFAKLLRQSLEHSRKSFLPIGKELEMLSNYLQLQQMRFEGMFDYEIICDKELADDEDVCLPPMLLQPFVENAIQHGFRGITYKGSITVTVIEKEQSLHINITDNGVGLQPKTKDTRNQSLSTQITLERLEMLSSDTSRQSNLQIVANQPSGVKVIMVVPVTYFEN